jgi:hypothetical protein
VEIIQGWVMPLLLSPSAAQPCSFIWGPCNLLFSIPTAQVEYWGGKLVWGDFGQPYFWAKIKGGLRKKDEKTKKKLQNDKEKRKKRGKVRKIEKNDAKRCAY